MFVKVNRSVIKINLRSHISYQLSSFQLNWMKCKDTKGHPYQGTLVALVLMEFPLYHGDLVLTARGCSSYFKDFKIRHYRRLDACSPMSGGLDRVRSVVACCGAKTQIKLLHYQLRTTRNCSSGIHFKDVFPKSQR